MVRASTVTALPPSSAKPAAELHLPAADKERGGTDSVLGIKEAGLQGQGSQACCRELDWQMNNYIVLAEQTPSQHPDAQLCSLKMHLEKWQKKKIIKKTKELK